MLKKCTKCNMDISFKEFYITGLIKGYYKYTCPKCGAKYEVEKQSVIWWFLIIASVMAGLVWLNKGKFAILWILISIAVFQPLFFRFKKV